MLYHLIEVLFLGVSSKKSNSESCETYSCMHIVGLLYEKLYIVLGVTMVKHMHSLCYSFFRV